MQSESPTRPLRLLAIIAPLLVLTGCLGDGEGPQTVRGTPQQAETGLLVDSAVDGAEWESTDGESGLTGLGEFPFRPFEEVTFSVGDIVLGTVSLASGASVLTPVELTGSNNPTDQAAINQMVFLQSIDSDADHSNGITITETTRNLAAGMTLDFNDPDFTTQVEAVVAAITVPPNEVVDESVALLNFYTTYAELGGTDTFSFSFPGFPPVGGGVSYELVFSDEFSEGDTPNPEKWTIETGYGPNNDGNGNNEWQLYTDSPDNIRVEDGNLVIQARCPVEPCGVRDDTITSGKVNTLDKFEFRYGTVYARIKPPVGDGAWPAFWSLGANFPEIGWPRSGEIDFMEMHNAFSDAMTTHFTMHWCDETVALPGRLCFPQDQGWRFFTQNLSFGESLGDDFHVFEADWNSERIVGRIDGIEYFELDIDPFTMEEFLRDFYLILNVAMGGTLGSDNQPPNGNEVWPQTMLVDYVRVFQQVGGGGQDEIFIDFEDSPETYDFGDGGGFEGGVSDVIMNPEPEGINTSAQVARMRKFEGEDFAGSTLMLSPALDIALGSTFTMKVWSPRVVDVLFKFEPNLIEVNATHGGTGWEELSFDFSSFTGSVEGFTFIFDDGTVGDAGGNPDEWTFYYDDITQIVDVGPSLEQIDLPITFDDRSVDYTLTDFGEPVAAMTTLVGDPDDALNTVASTVKPVGAPEWAGTTMSTEDGLASPIPFSATETTIGVRVYSPDAGIPVRLKADDVVDGQISVETEVLTTVAGEWETLVFDFANEVEGAPLDLEQSYTALSIFFNFGTDGDTAGEKTYLWDDVVFGVSPPDDVAPTLTFVNMVSDNADQALAAAGDTVTVTLTADESIVTPEVMIAGAAADVTGAGVSWLATRTLADTDAEGAVTFSIEYADFAGNAGLPVSMTTDGSGVVLDVTAPTVAIEDAPAMFTTLTPIGLTFQFSEPVDGFGLGDIQTVNGAASNFEVIDDATYTADVTPTGTGDLTIGVGAGAATDPSGNISEMASDVTVVSGLDEDAPLLSVIGISSNGPDPAFARVGDVVTIDMTATEDIIAPTVTIAGSPSDPPTGGGTDWQASRTLLDTDADEEGLITFVINFEDVNGIAGPESTVTTDGSTVTFDITAPTVSIDGVPATIEFLDPIPVTFQFDEDVAGFDVDDIDVTNGAADAFVAVDDATYTADVTPDGAGTLTIAVAADAATDPAGNGNEAASVDATLDLQTVWREIWSDEFDGAVLDAANWTIRTDEDCPVPCDGVQSYRTDRVSVGGGVLRIEARDDVARGGPTYTSGLVDTRGKLEFRYGRIEIQATLPGTTGVAPTFWMLPATDAFGPWPQSGQVDLTRDPGDGGSMLEHTLHYGLPVPEDTLTDGMSASVGNTSVEYALEWEAGEIRWFVNDVHVVTETQDNWYAYGEDVDGVYTLGTGAAPFGEDFYLLISLPVPELGASGFPHTLEIESVRVFECANPVDPAAGTGCSTGTGVPPTVRPGAPFVPEPLPVYADGPAVISFNEDGTVNPSVTANTNTLQPDSTNIAPGMVVSANFDDGGNTVWRVNVTSGGSGGGEVFMASGALSASPPLDDGFDLTGGGTAGELLFSLRINTANGGTPQLKAGLQSPDGNGGKVLLALPPEGEWQNYSVKIADLLDPANAVGTGLDLTNVLNLFAIEAVGADVEFDVDDISVKVACRDDGGCQANARIREVELEVEYMQDFEEMMLGTDPATFPPNSLSDDGWRYFVTVFAMPNYSYFGEVPNGGPAFSAVVTGQGGATQGQNQLSIYNDYNNGDHGNSLPIEANVFRERPITMDDLGRTFTFSFDAKAGNINDPGDPGCVGTANPPCDSTALAFIKTLDPLDGFAPSLIDELDTTALPATWDGYTLTITIPNDPSFAEPPNAHILQFGFLNVASDFEPSGVFYDNLEVTK